MRAAQTPPGPAWQGGSASLRAGAELHRGAAAKLREAEVRSGEHAVTAPSHRMKEPDLDAGIAGHARGGRAAAPRPAVVPPLPMVVLGAHEECLRVGSVALVEDAMVGPELRFVLEGALVQ